MATPFKEQDVSIIIPVHNEEKTLNQCLFSARKQGVGEIVVVLDHCVDGSEKIAKTHAEKDYRVKVVTLAEHKFKRNFMAETADFGVSEAKGKVICFLDADTVLGENYVSSLLPLLGKSVGSVSGRLIPKSKRFLQFFETIGGTGRLIPKRVWDEIGGFHDIEACDTFMDLELLKKDYIFKVTEEALMYDIREYSMRKLIEQAIRKGRGRRQMSQSLFFMIGHGLYSLTRTPFGFVELIANIIGYSMAHSMAPRENMKRYEARRIREITAKLLGLRL